jgi:prepilin-type N-terminal cleavage/methylation domain-containing protein
MSIQPQHKQAFKNGFSLIELLIVLGIILALIAIGVPSMATIISNARLSGGVTNLSGLLQNCRMMAVKENKIKSAHFTVLGNGPVAYVKNAADTSSLETNDVQVQLGAPLTKFTTPTGTNAPPELTSTELSFTAVTSDPSFNSRGLPCEYSSGVCTSKGFVYYFKDTRPLGASRWAAVSISPAGRIKRWFWSGSHWH